MNEQRQQFELWVKRARVDIDLGYSSVTNCYHDLETDWLWLAYQQGYRNGQTASPARARNKPRNTTGTT